VATFKELQDRSLDGSKRAGLTDLNEIKSLVNQVYKEMTARLKPVITEVNKTLTVDDGDYIVSTDWSLQAIVDIRHMRITDSGTAQVYLLERVMSDTILLLRQTQSTSGGQMNFWAYDGLDLVRFYPAPSTTTTQLTISYIARPSALVNDADVPAGIPEEFHDVIVLGVLARSLRVWNPGYAMQYQGEYRRGIDDYRRWLNRMGGSWAPKVIVKGARSQGPFHDNSTYYSGME
jgi:hypothetical protein